jgi:hypothetical protein
VSAVTAFALASRTAGSILIVRPFGIAISGKISASSASNPSVGGGAGISCSYFRYKREDKYARRPGDCTTVCHYFRDLGRFNFPWEDVITTNFIPRGFLDIGFVQTGLGSRMDNRNRRKFSR